jgi:Zn-dependent M16 (insulinase) family peptidase
MITQKEITEYVELKQVIKESRKQVEVREEGLMRRISAHEQVENGRFNLLISTSSRVTTSWKTVAEYLKALIAAGFQSSSKEVRSFVRGAVIKLADLVANKIPEFPEVTKFGAPCLEITEEKTLATLPRAA